MILPPKHFPSPKTLIEHKPTNPLSFLETQLLYNSSELHEP